LRVNTRPLIGYAMYNHKHYHNAAMSISLPLSHCVRFANISHTRHMLIDVNSPEASNAASGCMKNHRLKGHMNYSAPEVLMLWSTQECLTTRIDASPRLPCV